MKLEDENPTIGIILCKDKKQSVVAKSFRIEAVYAAWGTNVEKRKYLFKECEYISDIVGCGNWFSRGITKNGHPRHPLYVDNGWIGWMKPQPI